MSVQEEKIRIKENHKNILMKKYAAAYSKLSTTLNTTDQPSIKEEIKKLEDEIDNLEKEIQELRASTPNNKSYRNYDIQWKENLHKIDFNKSKKIIKDVLERFEAEREEEAIFLLQESQSMVGHLCIKYLKSLLQDIGTWYPPCEYQFPPYKPTNKSDFLDFLATKFAVNTTAENLQEYTDKILEKVCLSLPGGNILFIYIDIYSLTDKDDFIEWFVQFWGSLVQRLIVHRNNHPLIKLVAVIAVRDLVPKACLKPSLCCTKQKYDGKKILELPLQKWTETEIYNWLWKFSGLNSPPLELKQPEIEQMARTIHKVSKGIPNHVYSELMEQMTIRVS